MVKSDNDPKNRKRKKKSYLLKIALFLVLCTSLYILAEMSKDPVRTEVIRYGTLEDKISVEGYAIRREHVINAPTDGMISCVAREGERISKFDRIATIFEGKVDENLQSRITRINEKIAEYERNEMKSGLVLGDAVMMDTVTAKTVEDIIKSCYDRNLSKISTYKNDLERIVTQRSGTESAKTFGKSKKEELIEEKRRLEASASSARVDIIAPASGVFSSAIDGFEGFFDVSDRVLITPEVLSKADGINPIKVSSAKKGEPIVKIVDNYEWYFAAAVDAKSLAGLKVGDYIQLRFPELSDRLLDANIDAISEEQSGKVGVVISCGQYDDNIYSARRLSAEIVRKTYGGFKVPKSAVRVRDDGERGVYIKKDSIAAFRRIEILHSSDEYVIAKEDNKMKNGLLLYDEVIISGSGIEDGKFIR
ncbi:MAG: HlyD family secretion protein [Firmicutes bacterium ADurb.Bin193]|nr:MAG: HlyD family secretion protein [Firmicutes bacterium ADurb.Bin193]